MENSLDNKNSNVVNLRDFRIRKGAPPFDLIRPLRERQPLEQTVAREDLKPLARVYRPDFANNPFSRKPPEGGYDTQVYCLPLLKAVVPDPIARNFILEDEIAQLILYTLQTRRSNDKSYNISYLRRYVRQFKVLRSDELSSAMRRLTELGFTYYGKPRGRKGVRLYVREEFKFDNPSGRALNTILLAPYVAEAFS